MPTPSITRPAATEHLPYYGKYIALVPEGDLVSILRDQHRATVGLLEASGSRADFAYASGKWTVKEVIGHIIDAERVFAYRALRFARADTTAVAGFDENAYVAAANFRGRTLDDLVAELSAVRAATIEFARHVDGDQAARRGTANGAEVSVRALLYIVVGHELHHVALLRERYGL
jgi:uncharacterized damage-inducible protein DinB